ncbi:MAG TPA: DinB family protein [Thermoanaerobaculia bacterium]|nr:DinB family protein [Thermoanaerobaculia bacterium]
MTGTETWDDLMRSHRAAVADFASAASAIEPDAWTRPRAEGKWTPAEIVEHLALSYAALLGEIEGKTPLRIHTPLWRQWLLRAVYLPRLVAGKPFPAGIKAPREIRPAASGTQQDAVARFRDLAARFEEAADAVRVQKPKQRLTHPFFGAIPLDRMVGLSAAHTRHHQRQLSPT